MVLCSGAAYHRQVNFPCTAMPIDLYVVRPGQTVCHAENRFHGALDPSLDEEGFRQVYAAANMLSGHSTRIVTSPLLRAVQTAQVFAAFWNAEVTVMRQFVERNLGIFEGLTHDEARLHFSELWTQDLTRQWDAVPPGGESIRKVFDRVAVGLDLIRQLFPDQAVVLITHGFVAQVVRALLQPVSDEEFFAYRLPHGGIERYRLGEPKGGAVSTSSWLHTA
jgi:probable phosphoglycerate mutase